MLVSCYCLNLKRLEFNRCAQLILAYLSIYIYIKSEAHGLRDLFDPRDDIDSASSGEFEPISEEEKMDLHFPRSMDCMVSAGSAIFPMIVAAGISGGGASTENRLHRRAAGRQYESRCAVTIWCFCVALGKSRAGCKLVWVSDECVKRAESCEGSGLKNDAARKNSSLQVSSRSNCSDN